MHGWDELIEQQQHQSVSNDATPTQPSHPTERTLLQGSEVPSSIFSMSTAVYQ